MITMETGESSIIIHKVKQPKELIQNLQTLTNSIIQKYITKRKTINISWNTKLVRMTI